MSKERFYKEYFKYGYFVYDNWNKCLVHWSMPYFDPLYTEYLEKFNEVLSKYLGKRVNIGKIKHSDSSPIKLYKKCYEKIGNQNGRQ